MLAPINGQAKRRDFVTYDFEWIPRSLEIRLCGVYDGKAYRCYRTIEAFLEGEITKANRHKWFFAHSGGRADLLFILESVSKNPLYEVEARMSGSSAVIAVITRHTDGEDCKEGNHKNCVKWTFVDSYWLFRTSLAKIGEKLGPGFAKAGPDIDELDDDDKIREWYAKVPFRELRDYNEQDCRILWHGIAQFQEVLLSIGGELQKTIASCAMRLFRRKYLTKAINTVPTINANAGLSYIASRVEVIQREAHNGYCYDINSSFPYAMTFPAPGNAKRRYNRRLPNGETNLYIAEATIEVPDCFLPPLPYRKKARVFFPVGKWRSWFSGVDLQLLEEAGGRIVSIGECIEFEQCEDLRAYAEDIYNRRKVATTEFEKIVLKYLLNSLYGKFGEDEEKCSLIMNPCVEKLSALRKKEREWTPEDPLPAPEMLFPGAWCEYHQAEVPHQHVPFATHITAIARRTIYRYDMEAVKAGGEVHYNDTDSISTNLKLWDDSNELGKLKLEESFSDAYYIAPKVYRRDSKVKAKGFSLGKTKETQLKRFQELGENREIEIERMARLKEMLRRGTWSPYEITVTKKLQYKAQPKRRVLADGIHTAPWTVTELLKMDDGGLEHDS